MARGRFVGLFLKGVARQATGTGAAMVGELGGRAPARKRTLERLGPTSVAQRTVVADIATCSSSPSQVTTRPTAASDDTCC